MVERRECLAWLDLEHHRFTQALIADLNRDPVRALIPEQAHTDAICLAVVQLANRFRGHVHGEPFPFAVQTYGRLGTHRPSADISEVMGARREARAGRWPRVDGRSLQGHGSSPFPSRATRRLR